VTAPVEYLLGHPADPDATGERFEPARFRQAGNVGGGRGGERSVDDAGQLLIGLTLGRRFCLPCLAYFELVQPRFGEGRLEDARPPRFANLVGAVFLAAATTAYAAGFELLGVILGGLVAGLALLAAATGFCTGCEAYKFGSAILGRPFVSCPLPPTPARRVTDPV